MQSKYLTVVKYFACIASCFARFPVLVALQVFAKMFTNYRDVSATGAVCLFCGGLRISTIMFALHSNVPHEENVPEKECIDILP